MTHKQRTERIKTLTRELSVLLAHETPQLPAVRIISGDLRDERLHALVWGRLERTSCPRRPPPSMPSCERSY
jgi:hypothetical protein